MEDAGLCGLLPLTVDPNQALPEMSQAKLLASTGEGIAIAVPEHDYHIRRHPLMVDSSIPEEAALYRSRTVVAPAMTMERLLDHWWFPTLGYLIGPDGRVWRHSTLGRYADPDFMQTGAVERDGEALILDLARLADCPSIEQPVAIASHYASHNYGHFLLDMVPWIHALCQAQPVFVSRPLLFWQKAIYRRLGVDPETIHVVREPVVRLRSALISSRHLASGTYAASPAVAEPFRTLRDAVLRRNGSREYARRIFVVRGPHDKRSLRNRHEIADALSAHGFIIIRPDHVSFDEQVATFAHADLIVIEFGAAAASVGFSAPGTRVVEIVPEGQKDPWSLHLCAALGLEHIPLFNPVANADRSSVVVGGRSYENFDFDYVADLGQILDVVERLAP